MILEFSNLISPEHCSSVLSLNKVLEIGFEHKIPKVTFVSIFKISLGSIRIQAYD